MEMYGTKTGSFRVKPEDRWSCPLNIFYYLYKVKLFLI